VWLGREHPESAQMLAIAADVGYESEAAFNRAFKKYVGVPPGSWRKGKSPRKLE
jgi:AraC-like DNA-binding protein